MNSSVKIESTDKALMDAGMSLKRDGVELLTPLGKAFQTSDLHEITAYIDAASSLLIFLKALFDLVQPIAGKYPSATTIRIEGAENMTNVIQFIDANKGQINVNIVNEHAKVKNSVTPKMTISGKLKTRTPLD
jgi:hypothetical protein